MKNKFLNKFSMLISIFSFIFMFQLIVFTFQNTIEEKTQTVNHLQTQIDTVYLPQEQQYEESIERIVTYINSTDQYLNIGGFGTTPDSPEYIDSNVFESIMNRDDDQDFTTLLTNVETFFNERSEYLDTLPSIWPLEYSPLLRITSPFGTRYNPFTDRVSNHGGIDLASTWNASVLATAPGVIEEHWIWHDTFGKYIVINHNNGYRTHYAHLSETYIHEGLEIERGQVIGRIGSTGISLGRHLHYGISKWDEESQEWILLDPIAFMREAVYN